MILRFLPGTGEDVVQDVKLRLETGGLAIVRSPESERPILAAIGKLSSALRQELERHPAIEERIPARGEQLLVQRNFRCSPSIVALGRRGEVHVGGPAVVVIAGPCSVEGRDAVLEIAQHVRRAGAHILRGGAFKPRTSPYAFQGLGVEGLRQLKDAGEKVGLLGAKRQANAPRRWPTAGLAGAALVGVVAAVVIPGTGDSYGKRKLVFDANTYLAARWAGRHLDPNKVDSLEVGFPGYLYTVGELGRLGGSTSALRFSGSYPSDIWLGDVDRRYLVTSDLDALKGTLGARLTPSIRVLHRVGKAAVIDRGAATPWYRAALRVIGSPKRTGSEFVTSVHVRNSGLGAWPAESEGEQGAIRLGAKIIRPDGSEVVEARSPIQRSPTLVTAPGESRTVDIRVPVPPPGTYTLIVDMVWEHIMWFNPKFDRALEFPLVVRANAPH